MLSTNAYSAAGAQSDGGNEGNVSKYEKGHKLVLSAKYLEKKADKFLKKGNTKKAEKTWQKLRVNTKKHSNYLCNLIRKNQIIQTL